MQSGSTLQGVLFPWRGDTPVLVNLPGSKMLFIPCFSSEELLSESLAAGGVEWDCVRTLNDPDEFVTSLHQANPRIRVILDLHQTTDGRLKFTEVGKILH